MRITSRVLRHVHQREHAVGRPALIYGAGPEGRWLLHELLQRSEFDLRPVGFLDDDPTLWRRTVDGMAVLGGGAQLESILRLYAGASVVLASPAIGAERLRYVLALCRARGIPVLMEQVALIPAEVDRTGLVSRDVMSEISRSLPAIVRG